MCRNVIIFYEIKDNFFVFDNYRVFTGNCGKVIGNNTAVYQVIQLLLYYLYCQMLVI